MVKLDAVRAGNASLVQSQPLVAAFFGGTGTIASQTLRELAKAEGKYAGKGLRAYVVGRDAKSAEEVIKDCQKTCPSAEVKFIQAGDMSLMKEVDRLCATVTKAEEEQHVNDARIDYLMIAQGGMIFQPRNGKFVHTKDRPEKKPMAINRESSLTNPQIQKKASTKPCR